LDQLDLTLQKNMWLEEGKRITDDKIVCCKRIGLSKRSEEWQHKPLRFYTLGNDCISVRNKEAEMKLET